MGPLAFFSCAMLLFLAAGVESGPPGSNRCPPASKVPYTKPACVQDYDCKHGKVCCRNQGNTKSCAYPAPYHTGSSHHSGGGPGVFCDGVKCSPFEVCKLDPVTKRRRCQRA